MDLGRGCYVRLLLTYVFKCNNRATRTTFLCSRSCSLQITGYKDASGIDRALGETSSRLTALGTEIEHRAPIDARLLVPIEY